MTDACAIVRDLLPLYVEDMLSPESAAFVEAHLAGCADCREKHRELSESEGVWKPAPQNEGEIKRSRQTVQKKLRFRARIFFTVLMTLGLLWGFDLGFGAEVFYNILLMPAIGALGYLVFRRAAFYTMPLLLPVVCALTQLTNAWRGAEHIELGEWLSWSLIYDLFVLCGVLIAFLIHFGRKKQEKCQNGVKFPVSRLRIPALCLAAVTVLGLLAFAFMGTGNPVSAALVKRAAGRYLATEYAETGCVLDSVVYDFKSGGYYVKVSDPTRVDGDFTLRYNMAGDLLYDGYENAVTGGANTANRLNEAYRLDVNEILQSPVFPYVTDMAYGRLKFSYEVGAEPPAGAPAVSDLVPDRFYDMREMGARCGYLVLYVQGEAATPERAAEVLKECKRLLDQAGVTFYAVEHLVLMPLHEADGTWGEGARLSVTDVTAEQIESGDLVAWIRENCVTNN